MRFIVFLLTIFLVASACVPARQPEPSDILWPLPPEQPRIKYLQSVYSEDDIGRVYSWRERLFGKTYLDSLSRPYGVSVSRNKIYVADIIQSRVLIFDLAMKRLSFLGSEGSLKVPAAVAADSNGTTYVADAAQSKVVVFDAGGNYRTAFSLSASRPVALAFNETLGRLYVLDRSGSKVVVLNRDGVKLLEFGVRGNADGQFNLPLNIALDRSGKVYVLDTGNFRVQIFDGDGKFLSKFGMAGDQPGMFSQPKGIAVDSDGHIYVTDVAFNNFQIFDQEGKVLLFVGQLGSAPGQMYLPAGIAIDQDDRIYVADQLNRRIEIFQYLKVP